MQKLKKVSINLIPALIVFIVLPVVVFAQLPTTTPSFSVPGLTLIELETLIRRVTQFLTIIGVLLAITYIIWGAIKWLAAGSDEKKLAAAKEQVRQGVWATLIILAVGLIIQTLVGVVSRIFFQ